AFANALAVALANALKFEAIREEAYRRIRAAYVDPVTGVGNLMMLEEESRAALAAAGDGNLVAVSVIGLNRFAEVNDLLGAHAADQMLRAVATRLGSVVRRCDVVARLHGAEYVLLFRELASEAAAEAQAELAVRSLGTAITADGLDLTVDAHTGVACAPSDGIELDDLVRRARLAMYKARAEDVPVFRYRPELEPPAIAQVELVRDLRDALSERQLILHFQPKFDLKSGLPIAAEALVRWQHPVRGLIPPVEFIPLLERCGLVGDLTRYVLEGSIEECAEWQRMGLPLSVAVNLSARNLLDEDLPRFVLECLARNNLPTDRLICEITETAVFSRSPIAASVLDQLRAAGVGLSLDDFCTGYSSLSLLRERTIDEIKIDRSFVNDLGVESRSTQIVTTLIELAHRCDIIVTAEGIETKEQQELLTALDCDHAQGFLLARPMPVERVRAFFLEAMQDAEVTPLPLDGRPRLRSVAPLANWGEASALPEASSE
ncbi:MAG: putative bifunctional diguanylate cyclase/phosphodiesterase, partial [Acidothermaceae bacterium]